MSEMGDLKRRLLFVLGALVVFRIGSFIPVPGIDPEQLAELFRSQRGLVIEPGIAFRLTTMVTLTTGTMFLMWLGEQITERGIGNGISLI
ncbi:MAG TPA: hypothetical protein VNK67_03345, partial [Burkholderiales bacterium]|nr:hypothetical protein [Burkholderiales bacterium]